MGRGGGRARNSPWMAAGVARFRKVESIWKIERAPARLSNSKRGSLVGLSRISRKEFRSTRREMGGLETWLPMKG